MPKTFRTRPEPDEAEAADRPAKPLPSGVPFNPRKWRRLTKEQRGVRDANHVAAWDRVKRGQRW